MHNFSPHSIIPTKKVTAAWLLIWSSLSSKRRHGRKLLRRHGFERGASTLGAGLSIFLSAPNIAFLLGPSLSVEIYIGPQVNWFQDINNNHYIAMQVTFALFHSRFSRALWHRHYFYFTEEWTADELQGPWTTGLIRKSGAETILLGRTEVRVPTATVDTCPSCFPR